MNTIKKLTLAAALTAATLGLGLAQTGKALAEEAADDAIHNPEAPYNAETGKYDEESAVATIQPVAPSVAPRFFGGPRYTVQQPIGARYQMNLQEKQWFERASDAGNGG